MSQDDLRRFSSRRLAHDVSRGRPTQPRARARALRAIVMMDETLIDLIPEGKFVRVKLKQHVIIFGIASREAYEGIHISAREYDLEKSDPHYLELLALAKRVVDMHGFELVRSTLRKARQSRPDLRMSI